MDRVIAHPSKKKNFKRSSVSVEVSQSDKGFAPRLLQGVFAGSHLFTSKSPIQALPPLAARSSMLWKEAAAMCVSPELNSRKDPEILASREENELTRTICGEHAFSDYTNPLVSDMGEKEEDLKSFVLSEHDQANFSREALRKAAKPSKKKRVCENWAEFFTSLPESHAGSSLVDALEICSGKQSREIAGKSCDSSRLSGLQNNTIDMISCNGISTEKVGTCSTSGSCLKQTKKPSLSPVVEIARLTRFGKLGISSSFDTSASSASFVSLSTTLNSNSTSCCDSAAGKLQTDNQTTNGASTVSSAKCDVANPKAHTSPSSSRQDQIAQKLQKYIYFDTGAKFSDKFGYPIDCCNPVSSSAYERYLNSQLEHKLIGDAEDVVRAFQTDPSSFFCGLALIDWNLFDLQRKSSGLSRVLAFFLKRFNSFLAKFLKKECAKLMSSPFTPENGEKLIVLHEFWSYVSSGVRQDYLFLHLKPDLAEHGVEKFSGKELQRFFEQYWPCLFGCTNEEAAAEKKSSLVCENEEKLACLAVDSSSSTLYNAQKHGLLADTGCNGSTFVNPEKNTEIAASRRSFGGSSLQYKPEKFPVDAFHEKFGFSMGYGIYRILLYLEAYQELVLRKNPLAAASLFAEVLLYYPRDMFALLRACLLLVVSGKRHLIAEICLIPEVKKANLNGPYFWGILSYALEQANLPEFVKLSTPAASLAIELNMKDSWAHHALSHCLYSQGKFADGVNCMLPFANTWSDLTSFQASHNWWHLGLFLVELNRLNDAFLLYDMMTYRNIVNPNVQTNAFGFLVLLYLRVSAEEKFLEMLLHLDKSHHFIEDDFGSSSEPAKKKETRSEKEQKPYLSIIPATSAENRKNIISHTPTESESRNVAQIAVFSDENGACSLERMPGASSGVSKVNSHAEALSDTVLLVERQLPVGDPKGVSFKSDEESTCGNSAQFFSGRHDACVCEDVDRVGFTSKTKMKQHDEIAGNGGDFSRRISADTHINASTKSGGFGFSSNNEGLGDKSCRFSLPSKYISGISTECSGFGTVNNTFITSDRCSISWRKETDKKKDSKLLLETLVSQSDLEAVNSFKACSSTNERAGGRKISLGSPGKSSSRGDDEGISGARAFHGVLRGVIGSKLPYAAALNESQVYKAEKYTVTGESTEYESSSIPEGKDEMLKDHHHHEEAALEAPPQMGLKEMSIANSLQETGESRCSISITSESSLNGFFSDETALPRVMPSSQKPSSSCSECLSNLSEKYHRFNTLKKEDIVHKLLDTLQAVGYNGLVTPTGGLIDIIRACIYGLLKQFDVANVCFSAFESFCQQPGNSHMDEKLQLIYTLMIGCYYWGRENYVECLRHIAPCMDKFPGLPASIDQAAFIYELLLYSAIFALKDGRLEDIEMVDVLNFHCQDLPGNNPSASSSSTTADEVKENSNNKGGSPLYSFVNNIVEDRLRLPRARHTPIFYIYHSLWEHHVNRNDKLARKSASVAASMIILNADSQI